MAEIGIEVERIVREVLAEMGLAAGQAANPAAPSNGQPKPADVPQVKAVLEKSPQDLVVRSRVVTLEQLPQKLNGYRRLVVPPRAVVTPAVQDLLHKNRMTVSYAAPEVAEADGRVRVVMVTLGSYDASSLAKTLVEDGFPIETQKLDCLIAASDLLAAEVRSNQAVGVLLTRHVSAALCLTNRLAKVRAVAGMNADQATADADACGANVLVLDPRAHGQFAARQMIRKFVRGAPRECPEVFKKRLG